MHGGVYLPTTESLSFLPTVDRHPSPNPAVYVPRMSEGGGFSFVLPVTSPHSANVEDYKVIETLLKGTVKSLLNQTHPEVSIVVVCHQIPVWARSLDGRVRFLDISANDDLRPGIPMLLDKGAKCILGSIYADRVFGPRLFMLADADDLVNVELAERLLATTLPDDSFDGYLITNGAETKIRVTEDDRLQFQFAIVVSQFDRGCGTCRIFESDRLNPRIRESYPKLQRRFDDWKPAHDTNTETVPEELLRALWAETESDYENFEGLVRAFGRHWKQSPAFKFVELDFVAAAKVCGHGNHAGLNGGQPHWSRELRSLPLEEFRARFGLSEGSLVRFQNLALFRARMANPHARRKWLRQSKPARMVASLLRRTGLR